jgi:hypothetical protein
MTPIRIVGATWEGIPVEARCDSCHAVWVRPDRDPSAATLVLFALRHRNCPEPDWAGVADAYHASQLSVDDEPA